MGRLKRQLPPLFSLLLFSLFSHGCALRTPAPPRARAAGIYHVVKPGENLFRIGKAYGLTYQELSRINRITDPNQIHTGQKIFIPGATRQLPVEIITPLTASLERPKAGDPAERPKGELIWPVTGHVTSKFGPRSETFHDGIDIKAPEGSPIRAVEKGEVIYSDKLRGYGNLVIIRHPDGLVSVYAHNQANLVREGQTVGQGEVIGEVGNTGRASTAHLHFEIRKDNVARDPLYYLPQS